MSARASAPRIAIAMVVDNFLTSDLRNATIENKRAYARHWGYDLVVPDVQQVRDAANGLPSAWAKFPVLLQLLDDYDYVLMIDADAVFLRYDIGLHGAVQQMERDNTSVSFMLCFYYFFLLSLTTRIRAYGSSPPTRFSTRFSFSLIISVL